jgi:hypothetical protein
MFKNRKLYREILIEEISVMKMAKENINGASNLEDERRF